MLESSSRKRYLAILLSGVILVAGTGLSASAEVNVTSETLLRVFEREDSVNGNQEVLPVYEYLRVEAGALQTPGLSLHLQGWGRGDLSNSDYYTDQTEGELLYGYLQYVNSDRHFTTQLGRLSLFSGVTRDTIDGLSLQTTAIPHLSLSLYGGQPAAYDDTQGRSGDSIYGGRIGLMAGAGREIGFSAKESRNDNQTSESRVGVDLAWALPAGLWIGGLSSYNRNTSVWGEHAYEMRIPIQALTLRPFFEQYDYEGYFDDDPQVVAQPFRVIATSGETITGYGGDVNLRITSAWDIGARYKTIEKQDAQTTANRYSGLINWHGEGLSAAGIEVGRTDGDAEEDRYQLGRFFFYIDRISSLLPQGFVSGDVIALKYDQKIYDKDRSLFASLSIGHRFWGKALDLSLSGDYSDDPYFDQDFRGMLLVTYRFDSQPRNTKSEAVQ